MDESTHKFKILQQLRLILEKDLKSFVDKTGSWNQYKNGLNAYEIFINQINSSLKEEIKSIDNLPKEFPDGWKSPDCNFLYKK